MMPRCLQPVGVGVGVASRGGGAPLSGNDGGPGKSGLSRPVVNRRRDQCDPWADVVPIRPIGRSPGRSGHVQPVRTQSCMFQVAWVCVAFSTGPSMSVFMAVTLGKVKIGKL